MSFLGQAASRIWANARSGFLRLGPWGRGLLLVWIVWVTFLHVLPSMGGAYMRLPHSPLSLWPPPLPQLQTPLSRWDSRWFFAIARDGYSYAGPNVESTVRFYPLYPLLMAGVHAATGLGLMWAGTLVSALSLLGTLLLLAGRARADEGDEPAFATVEVLLFFPSAFILATVYSDSLSLFTMVLAVTLARRGNWIWAGLAGAACATTRLHGALVLLPLAAIAVPSLRARRSVGPFLGCGLAALGACAYPLYLWSRFGDPLLYFAVRPSTWTQQPRFFLFYIWDLVKGIASAITTGSVSTKVQAMPFVAFPFNIGVVALMGWTLVASIRKKKWDDTALMAGGFLLSTSVGSLDSVARHCLIFFPMYLRLGETLGSHRFLRLATILVFLSSQVVLLYLFLRWAFVL